MNSSNMILTFNNMIAADAYMNVHFNFLKHIFSFASLSSLHHAERREDSLSIKCGSPGEENGSSHEVI